MYFTEEKERTAETLRPGLEFDNFKPRLESGIFNYVFWLTVHFLVLIRVSCKRESKACLMSQIFASSLAKFFLSSHPWSILLALENLKRQLFPFRERKTVFCKFAIARFVVWAKQRRWALENKQNTSDFFFFGLLAFSLAF
jgi:hypothetical protein